MSLVLASSSKSRKKQLAQLKVPFEVFAPEIDETQLPDESPTALVMRLAREKALAAKSKFPNHVIIAGDQVHVVDSDIHGKPHNADTAFEQLSKAQGQKTKFLSGISVLNTNTDIILTRIVCTEVNFKQLTAEQIKHYISIDKPFECAGSIRIEGIAPCLIQSIQTEDPTAITGMPLIICCNMLADIGFDILDKINI